MEQINELEQLELSCLVGESGYWNMTEEGDTFWGAVDFLVNNTGRQIAIIQ